MRQYEVRHVHPAMLSKAGRRIRLNVIVADPGAVGATARVRAALHLDEDPPLPF